jgi:hypothetical protein
MGTIPRPPPFVPVAPPPAPRSRDRPTNQLLEWAVSKVLKSVSAFRKSGELAEHAREVGLIAFVCVVATGQLVMAGLHLSWEQLPLLMGRIRRGLR